jgi:hypothetical protein
MAADPQEADSPKSGFSLIHDWAAPIVMRAQGLRRFSENLSKVAESRLSYRACIEEI